MVTAYEAKNNNPNLYRCLDVWQTGEVDNAGYLAHIFCGENGISKLDGKENESNNSHICGTESLTVAWMSGRRGRWITLDIWRTFFVEKMEYRN